MNAGVERDCDDRALIGAGCRPVLVLDAGHLDVALDPPSKDACGEDQANRAAGGHPKAFCGRRIGGRVQLDHVQVPALQVPVSIHVLVSISISIPGTRYHLDWTLKDYNTRYYR